MDSERDCFVTKEIMDSENGYGKRRAAPTLSKENWRVLFNLQENNLEGKDVFWVISESWTPQTSQESTPTVKGLRNSMHSPEWKRANAIARYELFICLCQDD